MRIVKLPLTLEAEKGTQINVSELLTIPVLNDRTLMTGLDNILLGQRILKKLDAFGGSGVLELEEAEWTRLVKSIEACEVWGPAIFTAAAVLESIRDMKEK